MLKVLYLLLLIPVIMAVLAYFIMKRARAAAEKHLAETDKKIADLESQKNQQSQNEALEKATSKKIEENAKKALIFFKRWSIMTAEKKEEENHLKIISFEKLYNTEFFIKYGFHSIRL